jgi:hypothetical protein
VQFSESFNTPAGFYNRFDVGLSGFHPNVDPNAQQSWEGDHGLNCDGAAGHRIVNLTPSDAQMRARVATGNTPVAAEEFWWCDPSTEPSVNNGHLMTSFLGEGYAYGWFAPKGWQNNVSKVCWDQNTTMLGGRSWTGVEIIGRADVEREQAENGGVLQLGFSHPGFTDPSGPSTHVLALDTVEPLFGIWELAQLIHPFQGDAGGGHDLEQVGAFTKHENVATRYRHCMTDNGNNTVTFVQVRPDGTHTQTITGSFPDGDVKVSFITAFYNNSKDAEYDPDQNTWHWDNLEVS